MTVLFRGESPGYYTQARRIACGNQPKRQLKELKTRHLTKYVHLLLWWKLNHVTDKLACERRHHNFRHAKQEPKTPDALAGYA